MCGRITKVFKLIPYLKFTANGIRKMVELRNNVKNILERSVRIENLVEILTLMKNSKLQSVRLN